MSNTYHITRRLEFDAGHRVYMHESKCNNIHGHRYVVEIECTGALDSIGRVIDFSVIKSVCGKWIDDNLDHGMLLYKDDPLVAVWRDGLNNGLEKHKYWVMDKNPTAENIAEELFKTFTLLLYEYNVKVTSIIVHETPNCFATYKGLTNG